MLKKIYFLLIFSIIACDSSDAKNNISINGHFLGLKKDSHIKVLDFKSNLDVVDFKVGKSKHFEISFKGDPGVYRLFYQGIKDNYYVDIIVDSTSEPIDLTIDARNEVPIYKSPNSKSNQDYYTLLSKLDKKNLEIKSIVDYLKSHLKDKNNSTAYKEGLERYKKEVSNYNKLSEDFIQNHKNTLIGKLVKNTPYWFPERFNLSEKEDNISKIAAYWTTDLDLTDKEMTSTPLYHDLVDNYISIYYKTFSVREGIPKLKSATDLIMKQFKNSPLSIRKQVVSSLVKKINITSIEEVLKYFDNKYVDSSLLEGDELISYTRRMSSYRDLQKGKLTPNITFKDDNGRRMTINDIVATYTLLVFWDSECSHCKEQMPLLEEFLENHPKKYKALAVSSDDNKESYENFIKKLRHMYHYCDFEGYESKPFQGYYITGTPSVFVLDSDKKLIKKFGSVNKFLRLVN